MCCLPQLPTLPTTLGGWSYWSFGWYTPSYHINHRLSGRKKLWDQNHVVQVANLYMKTIAKEANQFCTRLAKQYPKNQEYQKLIDTIQTRGSRLFADPLAVDSAAGTILIQPQRTNNLLETFFSQT